MLNLVKDDGWSVLIQDPLGSALQRLNIGAQERYIGNSYRTGVSV